ncbi:hypothetical protein C7212DRAFT_284131 [Tuber magnatum]|uniref:Yeast cell wall synthesis Kre9/Knh1-like N-terminal domain-containing protein n=1 Tax=Tuber magnatum TaxID=42249 RepID=A0A317SH36_9PEZI|nr:hypothetical protein C7212DRAFT_284131 [Tuber magnatum]
MRYPSLLPVVLSALTGAIGAFAQGTSGGNAITYPLGGSLDANVPLTITWTPTTKGTITINLLKGPPNNLVDLGPILIWCLASINNAGTFTWNVPNSLQDSGSMPKGDRYGFKIIDDGTNTFEYSPPFDLSIPGSTFGGATVSGAPTASPTTSAASVSSNPSTSIPVTPTTTPASTVTQESTSDFLASTTQPPVPTSTDLPSGILPTSLETSLQSSLATASTMSAPKPSQSKVLDILDANTGPNVIVIISASAGAFGGLALLIISVVLFVKCRKRRSRARARAPLVTVQMPVGDMRGYGNGMYNRV